MASGEKRPPVGGAQNDTTPSYLKRVWRNVSCTSATALIRGDRIPGGPSPPPRALLVIGAITGELREEKAARST